MMSERYEDSKYRYKKYMYHTHNSIAYKMPSDACYSPNICRTESKLLPENISTKREVLSRAIDIERNHTQSNIGLRRSRKRSNWKFKWTKSQTKHSPHNWVPTLDSKCLGGRQREILEVIDDKIHHYDGHVIYKGYEWMGYDNIALFYQRFSQKIANNSLVFLKFKEDKRRNLQSEFGDELVNRIESMKNLEWERISDKRFKEMAMESKIDSAAIQAIIRDFDLPEGLSNLVKQSINDLFCHKYGCYILSHSINKSKSIFIFALKTAKEEFVKFSNDQFGSRVLQALAIYDPNFRSSCLLSFRTHWNYLTNSVPSIFLLSICLEFTSKEDDSFQSIGKMLETQCAKFKDQVPKQIKKGLVTYLEHCDMNELNKFLNILNFKRNFIKRMDDKYMVYIFSVFISREFEPALNIIRHYIQTRMIALLSTAHFPYLIDRLLTDKWKDSQTDKGATLQTEISSLILSTIEAISNIEDLLCGSKRIYCERQYMHILSTIYRFLS